ncbi:MAG: amidohydrolase [Acidobacteria bacterium]|nr:MAG: amidohydrolase [Acidobacteriota bacterium]
MKIIDTHQHLWDLELFTYSWLGEIPSLGKSFRMTDYLKAAEGLGIEKSIHMEADVDEPYMLGETRHILALAEQDNPLEGVVACGRPENAGFADYLDQIAGHPRLKGVRRVLHTQPDEVGQSRLFVENVRLLAAYGLSFDICIRERQLPIAVSLISNCPKVSFILDHCGNPQVKDKRLEPWREQILEASKFPNVVCKISGILANADLEKWMPEDLRPYIDHVIECFGWDRVMFGSDWPVCTLAASLRKWVETLKLLTNQAGEEKQRKLFYENAARVYRLE